MIVESDSDHPGMVCKNTYFLCAEYDESCSWHCFRSGQYGLCMITSTPTRRLNNVRRILALF